jgi:hypothetical protein
MAIRRPAIDTSSAEAVTGLIGLAMQFVAQGATEKLRLKEKKDAQSLILLGEQYRSVSDDLEKVESAYSQSKNLYEAQLGSVSPINRTEGSDSITGDLKDYYINEIDRRRSEKSKIQNKMNTMYSEMSDITRVQAGLQKSVTHEAGTPGVYDPEDFSTERLAKIFNVDPILIKKYREKQPEQIPSAITALEKLRLEAVQKKKGTGTLETTREQKKQMTDISSRISNARMFQDMTTIAVNDNLNDDEKVKGILSLGKEEGMSLGLILDPANEPKKGDSSKVIKKKRDAQYKEVMYLLNTFSSFTKKDAAKDVIGLGNFVNRLSNISNSLSPGAQSGFKKYVNNYFNIDLDNKEHFMLPGFALEAGQAVEESFDVRDMDKMTAEDLVLSDFKISGLSKFDYMDMAETQDKIFLLYKKKHPNLSDVDILSRIREVYNLL